MYTRRGFFFLLIAVGLLVALSPFKMAQAGGADGQKRSMKLKVSGVEPKGRGKVITFYKEKAGADAEQYLRVTLKGLVPYGEYTIIVDGFKTLTFRTSPGSAITPGGSILQHFDAKFALDEEPCLDGRPLPLELRPVTNIKKIEIYDSASRLVLSGEF